MVQKLPNKIPLITCSRTYIKSKGLAIVKERPLISKELRVFY